MNLRLDYIMAVLFAVALFVSVPSWYVTLELVLGWFWFGCLVLASLVMLFLITKNDAIVNDIKKKGINFDGFGGTGFNFRKDLISFSVSCIILYSASVQGFAGLFASLLIMLMLFHTLKAINWYLRQTKKVA
jgi:hypothetical protein